MTSKLEQLNNACSTSENRGSAGAVEEGNLAVALEGDALRVVGPSACGVDIPDKQDADQSEDEGANTESIDPASEFTVHSGIAFDLDATGPLPDVREDAATLAAARRLREGRLGYRALKRAFDVVFSLLVLVCLSWLFLIIAVAVKLDDPRGPVLFRQRRVGRAGADGEPATFDMYKFRSMAPDAEERLGELEGLNEKTGPVFKMRDDPRVTRVGRVLRKTSLDELPQFVNVLKGDISVVGPRPALPREVATYDAHQRMRLLVKPGITCYWQTRRNRDSITFDEWVDLDLLYIRKCGVKTDTKLIVQTVGCVLTAQGS